jgi:uncharacterized membrane protein YkoI
MVIYWMLVLLLVMGGFSIVQGEEVPEHLRAVIEERFPGAIIHEVDQERYKGQKVTELELTARDGIKYEVYVSEKGEIVKIEEED